MSWLVGVLAEGLSLLHRSVVWLTALNRNLDLLDPSHTFIDDSSETVSCLSKVHFRSECQLHHQLITLILYAMFSGSGKGHPPRAALQGQHLEGRKYEILKFGRFW